MSLFENREPLGHWRYNSGRKAWLWRSKHGGLTVGAEFRVLLFLHARASTVFRVGLRSPQGYQKGETVRSYSAERGSRCKINESETPWGRSWVNLVHAESFLCLKATITRTLNRRCLLVPRAKV